MTCKPSFDSVNFCQALVVAWDILPSAPWKIILPGGIFRTRLFWTQLGSLRVK